MKKILVIGSLNMDMVAEVHHTPTAGETILTDTMRLIPGGKGANQACAAGKLGAKVTMLGAVGKDSYGRILKDSLRESGVHTQFILERETSTGVAFITVNEEGNNCIVVVSGANASLMPEDIQGHLELIKESDIVILQMEIPVETVLFAARKAKELGKTVILDPAPVPKHFPKELFQYLDLIKPNETELKMLTGFGGKEEELNLASGYLRSLGVRDIVVTLGERGVYVNSEKEGIFRILGLKVEAVDTTAAGDSFTAAMALKMAQGENLSKAVRFANHVSAIVVTRKGAQSSIPSIEEVEKILYVPPKMQKSDKESLQIS